MKFLCDVHISLKVSKLIEELGYGCEHVNNILDKWHTKDSDITHYTDSNSLILITKDQDFRNSFLLSRKPKRLIKINLGNISNSELMQIIKNNMNQIVEINSANESFMIEIDKQNITLLV